MMTTVSLRRASPDDVAVLAGLEQACAVAPLSQASLGEELAHPDRAYFLAFQHTQPVGYLGVAILVDAGHVMTVGVLPERRRRGIATALLAEASLWLSTRQIDALTLEVRASNTPAQAFYARHSFAVDGVRPGYYADGEDALIMWKRGL
jgi:ribosomal-protein-alanine N-acetyltransferase